MTAAIPYMDETEIAGFLSALTGTEVVPVPGGFRVKETGDCWVDVIRQIFNWRICRTPKDFPLQYDRHWCYAGTGWTTLMRTVIAAAEWDCGDGTDPDGWNKNGQTGEWRPPA